MFRHEQVEQILDELMADGKEVRARIL